jgi:hypothetical protein
MPLTAVNNAPRAEGDLGSGSLAASQTVFKGALLMRNTATGATPVTFRPGTFRYRNSPSADAITVADIGKVCFVIDDERVRKRTAPAPARRPAWSRPWTAPATGSAWTKP